MDVSVLKAYLNEQIDAATISTIVQTEVARFKTRIEEKKSSVPVESAGYVAFTVKTEHLRRLCKDYLRSAITKWHIVYFCNVMDLSESFVPENTYVEEAIFILAEPDINYGFGDGLVSAIEKWLKAPELMTFQEFFQRESPVKGRD